SFSPVLLSYSVFVFLPRRMLPSACPLFPYTTLFRSRQGLGEGWHPASPVSDRIDQEFVAAIGGPALRSQGGPHSPTEIGAVAARSEEHTSELQSRENLVCRLLLEKKNKEGTT